VQVVAIEYLQRIASATAGFADVDDVPRFRTLSSRICNGEHSMYPGTGFRRHPPYCLAFRQPLASYEQSATHFW
jgi:hypothetical protein